MENKNAEIIKGLREYADWLEANPDLPEIYVGNAGVFRRDFTGDQIRNMVAVARAMGHAEKMYTDTSLHLNKVFSGDVRVSFVADRAEVCERVQVGVKVIPEVVLEAREQTVIPAHEEPVYEWRCEPLLAKESNDGQV